MKRSIKKIATLSLATLMISAPLMASKGPSFTPKQLDNLTPSEINNLTDQEKNALVRDTEYVIRLTDDPKNPANKLQIINTGMASLQKRLKMINSALNTIEVESFLLHPGHRSVRLLLQALLKKAKNGVTVRILVDAGMTSFEMKAPHIDGLNLICKEEAPDKCKKMQLGFYNDTPDIFGNFDLLPSSAQYRNHRKMLIIDGKQAITGGRNSTDEYFNLSYRLNFVDRDIHVNGPLAKKMQNVFNAYWVNKLISNSDEDKYKGVSGAARKDANVPNSTCTPEDTSMIDGPTCESNEILRLSQLKEYWTVDAVTYKQIMKQNDKDRRLLKKIKGLEKEHLIKQTPIGGCHEVLFASDKPGAKRFGTKNFKASHDNMSAFQLVREVLIKYATNPTNTEVIVSSAYLEGTDTSRNLLEKITDQGVDVTLMTNSISATDQDQVAAVFYRELPSFLEAGAKIYLHSSYFYEGSETFPPEKLLPGEEKKIHDAIWASHTKTQLYKGSNSDGSDTSFFIGSFNFDGRSRFFNTEAGIGCTGSPELAEALEADMRSRIADSIYITSKETGIHKGKQISATGTRRSDISTLSKITGIIFDLFDLL